MRVLHVDDDPAFLTVSKRLLEETQAGGEIEVVTAEGMEAGLDRLDAERVDCIVSDYEMPGGDGLTFLARVRETYPDLPFILFTGKGSEEVASKAISAGVTDYIQKRPGGERYDLLANRIRNAVTRDRSERALAEHTRRLQTLIDNLPGIVYRCRNEPSWPMEQVEGECEELTGYPASALESGSVSYGSEVVHEADRDPLWEAVQAALADRVPFEITYRIVTSDGGVKWVWERGRGIYEGDDLVALEGFITDITDRKRREAELETMALRLDAILEHTMTPMFMKNAEGRYVFTNRQFETLFGLAPDEAVGQTDHELNPGPVADQVTANDRTVLESGEPLEVEERVDTDEGSRTYLSSKVPIYEPDGTEPVAVFGVAVDITELKAREEELRRERDRLDEFAAIVSHDLRNPLSVAAGNLELHRDECDDPRLDTIERAYDRMRELIEDLLVLARQGQGVTDFEPVRLRELTTTCWETIETRDAELVVESERVVRADRNRLRQLLENLFANAVTHGGDDVTVTVGDLPDGFYVADTGDGIPEEHHGKVFDSGYTTTDGGTGFGLAIVRSIAGAHGWTVTLTESEAGGARFEITGVDRP